MFVALLVFWCVDKKNGYYLLTVSFIGLTVNQFLKLVFRVPRPWVIDPEFPIVESAREAASGYSFPSGHTQNAVNTYGSITCFAKRRAVRIACLVIIPLVALSRLYLGVHTPADVLVSLLIGAVLVLTLYPLMRRACDCPPLMYAVIACMIAMAVAFVLYVECFPFPADIDPANLASGRKNAWTVLGCALAMLPVYTVDHFRLHFSTEAPLPAQCCKLLLGAALTLAIKSLLKAPLSLLLAEHPCSHAVRYFLVVVFAAILWPMTFPLWTRLFSRRTKTS